MTQKNSITEDRRLTSSKSNTNRHHDEQYDVTSSTEKSTLKLVTRDSSKPRLSSRILVTWLELTIVGVIGGLLGTTVGGAPGFIIYLMTTLLTVGLIYMVENMTVSLESSQH